MLPLSVKADTKMIYEAMNPSSLFLINYLLIVMLYSAL
jgi:hypothetical protein